MLVEPSSTATSGIAARAAARVAGGRLLGGDDDLIDLRDRPQGSEVERMQRELLSRVGHELRTPLTSIIGYAELLTSQEVPPADMRSWHEVILDQAKRLHRVVEMLEFFAAASGGRPPLLRRPVGVRALVGAVAARWAGTLPEGSIIHFVEPDVTAVMADARWLTFAIDELIGNAVEFSPEGTLITVTAGLVPGETGRAVEITVADRGPGMPDLESVFGAFVQGDGSDTRQHGGLGLGLSLVRLVVEHHDGHVRVSSVRGQGSSLSILLDSLPTNNDDDVARS